MTSRFAVGAFLAWLAITAMWWALAFAPLPVPPDWLAEARNVCFGTQPNGLPEPWGWATLIASPLAMLGFLLGVWGQQLRQGLARMWRGPVGRGGLVAVAILVALGVGWVGHRVWAASRLEVVRLDSGLPEHLPETYPRLHKPAPDFDLVDQAGRRVSLQDLEGRPALVTFAFAHCRTVCPVVVNTVRQAALEMTEGSSAGTRPGGAGAPAVVVLTLDPWRDTPSSLPSLHQAWQLADVERSHVLSGEVDDVVAVLDAWEMPHERDPQTGDVAHPALVHVLASDGTIGYTFNGPPISWVVEAVERLDRAEAEAAG